MGSAIDEFRAQREAVQDVRNRLAEVADLLRSLGEQATAFARNEEFRKLLSEEETWLRRAEDVIRAGRYARECELQHFWPGVWRRWAVAAAFALSSVFTASAGYLWATQPYRAEVARLREAADVGDAVARRVLRMTPVERKEFDAIVKLDVSPRR